MKHLFCIAIIAAALVACQGDDYEEGNGEHSLMQADMAELHVNAHKRVDSFTTDDGNVFRLATPATASWIAKADTTYHAIVSFNRLGNGLASVLQLTDVPALRPVAHWKFKKQPQDPVGIESAWISASRRYINLALLLKTGQQMGSDGIHSIGLAQDTVLVNVDSTRTAYYRLLHDQGDIPQYYTSRSYASIVLPDTPPDTVRLTITTFDGDVERTFCVK